METELIRFLPNLVAAGSVLLIFIDWFLSDLRSWNREVEIEEKSRFDATPFEETGNTKAAMGGAEEAASDPSGAVAFGLMLLFSLVILGLSVYIVVSGSFDASEQRWAFGAAGMIVAYWLRPM